MLRAQSQRRRVVETIAPHWDDLGFFGNFSAQYFIAKERVSFYPRDPASPLHDGGVARGAPPARNYSHPWVIFLDSRLKAETAKTRRRKGKREGMSLLYPFALIFAPSRFRGLFEFRLTPTSSRRRDCSLALVLAESVVQLPKTDAEFLRCERAVAVVFLQRRQDVTLFHLLQ